MVGYRYYIWADSEGEDLLETGIRCGTYEPSPECLQLIPGRVVFISVRTVSITRAAAWRSRQ